MPTNQQNNREEPAVEPIVPYLFIGLGGSGKQILVQLRRMLIEKYGTYRLPHIRFLCIDTDLAGVRVDITNDNPYYGRANFSDQDELIDAAIRKDFLSEIFRNRDANRHIFSWFDPVLEKLGLPTHGAAQIRSFGRLAFFQQFVEIRDKITGHLNAINQIDLNVFREKYGTPLNRTELQVWVVHSLAGGTGSGMFLDCAFLMRYLAAQRNILAPVRSLALLPDLWTADLNDRRYANTYAALKELDFFNYSRGQAEQPGGGPIAGDDRYRVAWTQELYNQGIHLHPPVFETTYLVGADCYNRANGAQYLTDDKRIHFTQSIAEWMFNVSAGSGHISSALSSNLSNQLNQMVLATRLNTQTAIGGGQVINVTQEVSRAYASVGISKLFYPTSRLAEHARHKLASTMVQSWLDGSDPPGPGIAIGRHEKDLLIDKYVQSAVEEVGAFMRDRLGLNDQNEHTNKSLHASFETLRQLLEGDSTRDGVASMLTSYGQFGERYLSDEGIEANRGDYWRDAFLIRTPRLESELVDQLNAIIAAYYKTPNARSVHALNALSEISNRLDEVIRSQQELSDTATLKVEDYRDRFDQLVSFLNDRSTGTSRTVARAAVDELKTSATYRLARIHHNATRDLAKRLKIVVSSMIVDIGKLDRNIDKLSTDLLNAELELKSRIDPCHYEQAPVSIESDNSPYLDRKGNPILPERILQLEVDWYQGDFLNGVWGKRKDIPDNFKKVALDYAKTRLLDIDADRFDVLAATLDAEGIEGIRAKSQRIAHNSSVRIGRPTATNGYSAEQPGAAPSDYTFVLKSGRANEIGWQAFRESMRQQLPPNTNYAELVGPSDAVTVIQYQVAAPLAMIGGIQSWRPGYERLLTLSDNDPSRVVHTLRSVDTLSEVIALDQHGMAQRLIAVDLAMFAILCGFVDGSWGNGEQGTFVEWHCNEGPPFFGRIPIGRLQSLVQRIQARVNNGDTIISHLVRQTEQKKQALRNDGEMSAKVYLLAELQSRAMASRPDAPTPFSGVIGRAVPGWREAVEILKGKLVSDFPDLMAPDVLDGVFQTRDSWAEELPTGSGFWRLRR
jgi:Tubulin like